MILSLGCLLFYLWFFVWYPIKFSIEEVRKERARKRNEPFELACSFLTSADLEWLASFDHLLEKDN